MYKKSFFFFLVQFQLSLVSWALLQNTEMFSYVLKRIIQFHKQYNGKYNIIQNFVTFDVDEEKKLFPMHILSFYIL